MAYHHGNLRAALLDAALDVARTQGPSAIAMRKVTRQAGVTVNAAYRYFADLEALVAEVSGVAMDDLSQAILDQVRLVEHGDARERARLGLRAVGAGYVGFGLREPGLFDTAFHRARGMDAVRDTHPFRLLCNALDEVVATGAMSERRRVSAPVDCWAAMHGFVVLHRGPLADLTQPSIDASLVSLLDTLEHGLLQA